LILHCYYILLGPRSTLYSPYIVTTLLLHPATFSNNYKTTYYRFFELAIVRRLNRKIIIIAPYTNIGHFECSLFKLTTSNLTTVVLGIRLARSRVCCILSCFVVDSRWITIKCGVSLVARNVLLIKES
jgi:hypothetical protein